MGPRSEARCRVANGGRADLKKIRGKAAKSEADQRDDRGAVRPCPNTMAKPKGKRLKKIAADQLRLGMYVNELCGSWMDHPFWNTKFLLEDPADLETIHASSIKEIWIDVDRGLDVEATAQDEAVAPEETAEEAEARNEAELIDAATRKLDKPARVELAAEVTRAAAICGRARGAVTQMFGEARMGRAVDAENLEPLVEEISGSVMRNPGALVSLARLKSQDDYTYLHSVAVCGLMIALGRQLGFDEAQMREAGMAGLLHDIGKAAVPLDILNKPGKLTDEEFRRVQSHPVAGHEMLLEANGVGDVPLDVCLHHHEKVDGSGYPDKLSDEAISLYAKMGAVCDVYDAITSDRPYKKGWDPSMAIRKMNDWASGHFDNRIFQAFVKTVGIYPVGSLVKLDSGLLAVVSEVTDEALLTPIVKTFYCTKRSARMPIRQLDLAGGADRIAGWESPDDWNFPDLEELWSGIARDAQRRSGVA